LDSLQLVLLLFLLFFDVAPTFFLHLSLALVFLPLTLALFFQNFLFITRDSFLGELLELFLLLEQKIAFDFSSRLVAEQNHVLEFTRLVLDGAFFTFHLPHLEVFDVLAQLCKQFVVSVSEGKLLKTLHLLHSSGGLVVEHHLEVIQTRQHPLLDQKSVDRSLSRFIFVQRHHIVYNAFIKVDALAPDLNAADPNSSLCE